MTLEFNPAIDVYTNKAQPFARPILKHLRELVHKACPGVVETMKWSRPFFLFDGIILSNMAAFKQHCSLGIWGPEIDGILAADGMKSECGMGSFGRITVLSDLPPDKVLAGYLRQAAEFISSGQRTKSYSRSPKAAKPEIEAPAEFAAALKNNKAAGRVFAGFSPSCRREYIEWIAEAKRPKTRDRRIAQAVEWIAEGKQRNWMYQSCLLK